VSAVCLDQRSHGHDQAVPVVGLVALTYFCFFFKICLATIYQLDISLRDGDTDYIFFLSATPVDVATLLS
jgi:hypothetical protein